MKRLAQDVFTFDELSKTAKENAIENERNYRWQNFDIVPDWDEWFDDGIECLTGLKPDQYECTIDDINYGWDIKVKLKGQILINEFCDLMNCPQLTDLDYDILYAYHASGYDWEYIYFDDDNVINPTIYISTLFVNEPVNYEEFKDYLKDHYEDFYTEEEIKACYDRCKVIDEYCDKFAEELSTATTTIENNYSDIVYTYMSDEDIIEYLREFCEFDEDGNVI